MSGHSGHRRARTTLQHVQVQTVVTGGTGLEVPVRSTEVIGLSSLPPVTTTLAILQFILFWKQSWFGVYAKTDVQISWNGVIEDQQWDRLFFAQYFHFRKVQMFLNCIALVEVGASLEKRISWRVLLLIIQMYGMLSNIWYITLNRLFCVSKEHEFTYGFTWVVFALRVVDTMLKDRRSLKEEPTLVYGICPVRLPLWLALWWPLVETGVFDVVILDRCMVGNISGILAALTFPFIIKLGGLIPTQQTPAFGYPWHEWQEDIRNS